VAALEEPEVVAGDLRLRYVESIDALQQVSDRLVDALQEAHAAREVARRLVLSGRPLGDLEQVLEPQPLRTSLTDALADLERSRHEAQRLLFVLLHSEGQTLADIGRTYGISRQLVSRLVNEPDPPLAG
jgi:Homeodomain-like domain